MADCISRKTEIPQWYIVLNEEGDIIAGAGVVENDFHDRRDLAHGPVLPFLSKKPIAAEACAKAILGFVRSEISKKEGVFQAVSGDGTHGVL